MPASRVTPFFQRLRDPGYVDGRTITIDYLSAEERSERFPALAGECLLLKADIIVVITTPATQAAKTSTRTIPVVMIPLGDQGCEVSRPHDPTVAAHAGRSSHRTSGATVANTEASNFAVELAVNGRTAERLGLTIPQSLLGRADRVIQ
jgi:ABC-type uncharacterized transport system substrate-binding protein